MTEKQILDELMVLGHCREESVQIVVHSRLKHPAFKHASLSFYSGTAYIDLFDSKGRADGDQALWFKSLEEAMSAWMQILATNTPPPR